MQSLLTGKLRKQAKVLYKQLGVTVNSIMPARCQDGGVGFDTMLISFSLDLQSYPAIQIKPISCGQSTMGVFVFRRVQESYHGEPTYAYIV